MGYPAYSALLAVGDSISGPTSLGGPPTGYLWVVRFATMTHGSYAGFVRGACSIGGVDPWLWLWATTTASLIGISHATLEWEGRLVIPPDTELYVQTDAGDTCDFLFSGYVLSAAGYS